MKDNKSFLISVIVPIHIKNDKLNDVCRNISQATTPFEVIYVIEKNLSYVFKNIKNYEKIIKLENKGRGFMFAEGVRYSKGDVLVFLHSDTLLPKSWDKSIRKSLQDEKIVGGCFKLKFDIDNNFLKLAVKILTIRAKRLKIISGDRAIFIRSTLIKKNISILEIPIMEDIELSYLMRKNGKIITLKEKVITSADAFIKNGIFKQTIKIIICYFWYKIGGNLQKIYNFYYSKK